MDNVAKAQEAVLDYLKSRAEHLHTDPTQLLNKLRAFDLVKLRADIDHDKQVAKLRVENPTEDLVSELLSNSHECISSWEALNIIQDDDTIPLETRFKIIKSIPKERPKNIRGQKLHLRNMIIAIAVFRAIECGLSAYSNGNNTKKTACLLVSECLVQYGVALSCDSVIKIWKDWTDNDKTLERLTKPLF